MLPALSIITDLSTTPIALSSPVSPIVTVKTAVPFSLAVPQVCHHVQIVPTSPCRIWLNEIVWAAERTPDVAHNWLTQFTALGGSGYKTISRIEAAYSSTADVTLTITSYDGQSPAVITLPSTGGVYQKTLVTLTFNKGQLYSFGLVSSAFFQVYGEEWVVWVNDWGSTAPRPYQKLGGMFSDQAAL